MFSRFTLFSSWRRNMMKIPCMMFRGGTSKGPFFLKSDLPSDTSLRDQLLLSLMGSPHGRQIDGIGGGDSLSSKVAIVGLSEREDADIDYLLCQVHINEPIVETTLNCGNMLSAVAPFAIEKGLVKTTDPETVVRIYNENTGVTVTAKVQTPNGNITYNGDVSIDGVPGKGSPIYLNFGNVVGTTTGKLFPTGNMVDLIDGIEVSCLDVSIPVIFISANALGKNGNESKQELDQDKKLISLIQNIRSSIIKKVSMPYSELIPKVAIISRPFKEGNISSRYFTPMYCHAAYAVTGALCLSTACGISGTIPSMFCKKSSDNKFIVEHPSGYINVLTELDSSVENNNTIFSLKKAEFVRTARPLFEGNVLIRDDM